MGVHRALGEFVPRLHILSVGDLDARAVGHGVDLFLPRFLIKYGDLAALFHLADGNLPRDLGQNGQMLGFSRLEELLHAGKSLGDVVSGDAAGVEGTHGELGAGSPMDWAAMMPTASPAETRLPVGQVGPVALGADAVFGAALQHASDLDLVMPAFTIFSAAASPIICSPATITSPVLGSITSEQVKRPTSRSRIGSIISLPSLMSDTQMPSVVPQSSSRTITSWETSTRRRVRYPESAVRRAVSARPLRAPREEIKYSRTFKPSRKLALMGISMVRPEVLAMRPASRRAGGSG